MRVVIVVFTFMCVCVYKSPGYQNDIDEPSFDINKCLRNGVKISDEGECGAIWPSSRFA